MAAERAPRPPALLAGPRLDLRALAPADVTAEYVGWLNNPAVNRFLSGSGRFPATLDTVRAYVERFQGSRTDLLLAIVHRPSGQHIGNVTINRIDWVHRTADTGLLIGRQAYWGQGYAAEAWTLVAAHAFRRLGLRKLIAGAVAANQASIGALQRVGFKIEGMLREEVFLDGQAHDVVRLGLLAREWRAPQPRGARANARRRAVGKGAARS